MEAEVRKKGSSESYKQDFQQLLRGLKDKPSIETTKRRPTMRFHEAEDVDDKRYVDQWERTVDKLLNSIEPTTKATLETSTRSEATETGRRDSVSMVETTVQVDGGNHISTTIQETTIDVEEQVSESGQINITITETKHESHVSEDEGDDDSALAETDEDERPNQHEIDRMLDEVRQLRDVMTAQDAVLLKVLERVPPSTQTNWSYLWRNSLVIAVIVLIFAMFLQWWFTR